MGEGGGGGTISPYLPHRRSRSRSTSAYLAAGKIEIRQLTPDRHFTGARTAGEEAGGRVEGRRGARFIIARGAQGNKRAQVTARRERSHVPGFENGPSRLPRVI